MFGSRSILGAVVVVSVAACVLAACGDESGGGDAPDAGGGGADSGGGKTGDDGGSPGSDAASDAPTDATTDAGPPPPPCSPETKLCTTSGAVTTCQLDVTRAATINVTGAVSLDGYLPAGGNGPGVRFVDAASHLAGSFAVNPADGTYTATVVPGTYDVYFDYAGFGSAHTATKKAFTTTTTLDMLIHQTSYDAGFTRGGGGDIGSNPGYVWVVHPGTTDRKLVRTPGGVFASSWAGTYDLYASDDGADNPGLLAGTNVVVDGSNLSLTVTFARVTGTAKLDGVAAAGRMRFTSPSTGAKFFVNTDGAGAFSARVAPGKYDVAFDPNAAEVADGFYAVGTGLSFAADTAQDFALATSPVAGSVTLDGAAPGGTMILRDASGEEHATAVTAGAYATRVGQGTYDVLYDSGDPFLTYRVSAKSAASITGAATTTIGAALVRTTATFSLAAGTGISPAIYTALDSAGGRFRVFPDADGNFTGPVPPGTWDFYVATGTGPIAQTKNPWIPPAVLYGVLAAKAKVVGAAPVVLAPTLRDVSGVLTVGGTAATSNVVFQLTDKFTGMVYQANTVAGGDGHYGFRVTPGLYDVTALVLSAKPQVSVATCARID
jgi:hypothetical protein